jgi:DNA-binding CsgD family transcriptional regulator
MTSQHTTYNKLKKSAKQYQIEDRRRQVAIMVAQGISEVEIAAKLGVDNTTISKDIKALKLISQQFIYDITKSDFTYYYKQCLDMVKFILKKQSEIVDKENITKQDMYRAKILGDMLNTINTLNGYYNAAPNMHRTPMQMTYDTDRFGVTPGSNSNSSSSSNYENFGNVDLDKEDSLDEAEKEMIRSGKAMIVGRDKNGELIIDDHPDDFWD